MLDIVALANELGFSEAATISADDVVTSKELTSLCNPEACRQYGSCWTCQPAAGPFEQLQEHITSKDAGIVVQSIRDNVDFYEDWEILAETRASHNERLDRLAAAMREEFKDVMEFSTGGCDVCESCTYPDAPCRNPDTQRHSLSAHGVSVGSTCQRAGMDYSFENGRIRYVGMILYCN
jgi:predicted metal-binding protein